MTTKCEMKERTSWTVLHLQQIFKLIQTSDLFKPTHLATLNTHHSGLEYTELAALAL
jgi:hypothetical protein